VKCPFGFWAPGLAVVLHLACGPGADTGPPRERPVAPEFVLSQLGGGEVALADLAGKTVVIDFWATWCAPCEVQIPVLNAFHERHADGDVVVLGVSVDADGPEVVAPFAEAHAISYPVLFGDEALARRFGALGFPALAVVSPDGRIDTLHVGVVGPEELEEAIVAAQSR
jgi:thiol-disulfide isomerase/thioredoxin